MPLKCDCLLKLAPTLSWSQLRDLCKILKKKKKLHAYEHAVQCAMACVHSCMRAVRLAHGLPRARHVRTTARSVWLFPCRLYLHSPPPSPMSPHRRDLLISEREGEEGIRWWWHRGRGRVVLWSGRDHQRSWASPLSGLEVPNEDGGGRDWPLLIEGRVTIGRNRGAVPAPHLVQARRRACRLVGPELATRLKPRVATPAGVGVASNRGTAGRRRLDVLLAADHDDQLQQEEKERERERRGPSRVAGAASTRDDRPCGRQRAGGGLIGRRAWVWPNSSTGKEERKREKGDGCQRQLMQWSVGDA